MYIHRYNDTNSLSATEARYLSVGELMTFGALLHRGHLRDMQRVYVVGGDIVDVFAAQ